MSIIYAVVKVLLGGPRVEMCIFYLFDQKTDNLFGTVKNTKRKNKDYHVWNMNISPRLVPSHKQKVFYKIYIYISIYITDII